MLRDWDRGYLVPTFCFSEMYWHTRCRHTPTVCPTPRPLLAIILDASSRGRSSPSLSLSLSSSLEFGTIRQDPHRTGAAWPIYRVSSVTSPPPLGGQGRHPPTAVGWHLSQTAARLPSLVLSSLLHLAILDERLRLLSWSVHRIPHCRWPDRSTWF